MKQIALTGGFATGKSTVGRMFEDLGIPRIDADVLTHKLLETGTAVWQQIVATFGEEILHHDGQAIDRQRLGDIIFHDPKKRKQLEALVHPQVREAMHAEIARLKSEGKTKVILEIPLLFEAGWESQEKWDAILVVTCNEKIQLERAMKKFGLDQTAVQARLAAQLPLTQKTKKATFVIDNGGTIAQTRKQVETISKNLKF